MTGITKAQLDLLGVHRCFQRYSADQRATMASSHRLGHRQRQQAGEYYWTSELVPGVAFTSRGRAIAAAESALKLRIG